MWDEAVLKNPLSSESVNKKLLGRRRKKKSVTKEKTDGRKEGPREQESILIKLPKKNSPPS